MANDDQNNRDCSVGRCKPPIENRFRKGQSGNPKGRPRGSRNASSLWREELDERVAITENGKRRKVTRLAVIVKQVVKKAMSADLRACEMVFKMENHLERRDTTGDSVEGPMQSEGHPMLTIEYLRQRFEEHEAELTSRKNPHADSAGKDEPNLPYRT